MKKSSGKERGRKHVKQFGCVVFILFLLFVFFGVVSSYRLTVSRHEIRTPKLNGAVRLLLIADLHSCWYGKDQTTLVRAVEAEQPDVLMFCGDIGDDGIPIENAEILTRTLSGRYPSFYVTGNHEYWTGDIEGVKNVFRRCGLTILEGDIMNIQVRGETLTICGIDDPESGHFQSQLASATAGTETGLYSILLAHRPELFIQYAAAGFDLVLSGHTHGGLWRIPGLMNGFVSPNQGFFPKYTSGLYTEGNTTMIVSRGLARESTRIPRFFNPVELVVIDLLPMD